MYAIEARGLKKRFRNKGKDATDRWTQAVGGIDLCIDEGDICALLGPNGAGKTTTLMMLLGVTEPDEGKVKLLGHPLPEERTRALEQTNFTAAYVGMPYRVRVREILNVYETLYAARPGRIDEVMELFGIDEFAQRYSSQLSSGQRTLIGLAKALLSEPRLLVLDEPTASLDPEIAHRVREVLQAEHAKRRFTLLITSHNMADIERLCRRVVFMAGGRIVADGSPAEIAASYGVDDLEQTFLSIAHEARSAGGRSETEVRR